MGTAFDIYSRPPSTLSPREDTDVIRRHPCLPASSLLRSLGHIVAVAVAVPVPQSCRRRRSRKRRRISTCVGRGRRFPCPLRRRSRTCLFRLYIGGDSSSELLGQVAADPDKRRDARRRQAAHLDADRPARPAWKSAPSPPYTSTRRPSNGRSILPTAATRTRRSSSRSRRWTRRSSRASSPA